jgi:hypothetical protein
MSYSPASLFDIKLTSKYPARYKYYGCAKSGDKTIKTTMSIWKDTLTHKYYISDSYKIELKTDTMKYTLLNIEPSSRPIELPYRNEINNAFELSYDTMKSGYVFYGGIVWAFPCIFSS